MAKNQIIHHQRGYDFQQAAGEAVNLAELLRFEIWSALAFPDPIIRSSRQNEAIRHFGDSDTEWRKFVDRVNPQFIDGPMAVELPIFTAMRAAPPHR